MSDANLTLEQDDTLAQLAKSANERLESAGQNGATHAFNLGCSIGLGPATLIILLAFILSKGSWTVVFVTATMLVLILVVFSSLFAATAKRSTVARTYTRDIEPEIIRTLKTMEISQSEFDEIAHETLPYGSVLLNYLERQTEPSSSPSNP